MRLVVSRNAVAQQNMGSTGHSRIDGILELGPLHVPGRRKRAARMLAECAGEWETLINEGAGDTGAEFQERCARHALILHYVEGNNHEQPSSAAAKTAAV